MKQLLKPILIIVCSLLLIACQSTPQQDAHRASQARLKLGLAYLAMINYAENYRQLAYQNLSAAVQHEPQNLSAQLGMALYYQQVGDNSEAEKRYQQLLTQDPQTVRYHTYYAIFLCRNQRYSEAKNEFSFGFEHKQPDDYGNNLEHAAYCAIRQGDKVAAKDYLKQLFKYEPGREARIRENLSKPMFNYQDNPVVRFIDTLMLQA